MFPAYYSLSLCLFLGWEVIHYHCVYFQVGKLFINLVSIFRFRSYSLTLCLFLGWEVIHYHCVYFQVGKCVCKPGFYGKNCNDPCEDGLYGRYCQSLCNCGKSVKCDGVTGSCLYNCPAGRTGEKCDQGTMKQIFNCSLC